MSAARILREEQSVILRDHDGAVVVIAESFMLSGREIPDRIRPSIEHFEMGATVALRSGQMFERFAGNPEAQLSVISFAEELDHIAAGNLPTFADYKPDSLVHG